MTISIDFDRFVAAEQETKLLAHEFLSDIQRGGLWDRGDNVVATKYREACDTETWIGLLHLYIDLVM